MSAPTDRYFNTSDKYFSVNYKEHQWEYLDGVLTQMKKKPNGVTAEKKEEIDTQVRLPNKHNSTANVNYSSLKQNSNNDLQITTNKKSTRFRMLF